MNLQGEMKMGRVGCLSSEPEYGTYKLAFDMSQRVVSTYHRVVWTCHIRSFRHVTWQLILCEYDQNDDQQAQVESKRYMRPIGQLQMKRTDDHMKFVPSGTSIENLMVQRKHSWMTKPLPI